MERNNLIVLGAGSGGLTVAGGGAVVGARVALLEKHRMRADCLNYGCVPSKAFLRVAKVAHTLRNAARDRRQRVDLASQPEDLQVGVEKGRCPRSRRTPRCSSVGPGPRRS